MEPTAPHGQPSAPLPPAAEHALRQIPSVDGLLRQPSVAQLLDEFPRVELTAAVRTVLERRRREILDGRLAPLDARTLALEVRETLYQRSRPSLRSVINATGVVLHTGLGRAPLARQAVDAVAEIAGGYCNLELDLATGERGDRHEHVRALLAELTGAEDGLVVNNNAAATFLALNTLAAGRSVIVSRGQLVEIGGSYRMPEIMAAAGCRLREVGTTNRTRLADYERAIDSDTAALLRVHTSNYRMIGFVEHTPLVELVELGRRRGLIVIDDLGSGLLEPPPSPPGGEPTAGEPGGQRAAACGGRFVRGWDEPAVRQSVSAGADLTLFSGDKLLGGPQAGVLIGRAALVERLRKNPLMRALRPDKMTLAALEATLRLYRDPAALADRLPVLRMLTAGAAELKRSADALRGLIEQAAPGCQVTVQEDFSEAGGGALPGVALPTFVVTVHAPGLSASELAGALRDRDVPVLCRVQRDRLVLDVRTLLAGQAEQAAGAIGEAVRELSGT